MNSKGVRSPLPGHQDQPEPAVCRGASRRLRPPAGPERRGGRSCGCVSILGLYFVTVKAATGGQGSPSVGGVRGPARNLMTPASVSLTVQPASKGTIDGVPWFDSPVRWARPGALPPGPQPLACGGCRRRSSLGERCEGTWCVIPSRSASSDRGEEEHASGGKEVRKVSGRPSGRYGGQALLDNHLPALER